MTDNKVRKAPFVENSETIRSVVQTALDQLILSSERYNGLFPSLLDRDSGAMLTRLPDPIPGQRNSDRSYLGSNLIHDIPVLGTLYGLGIERYTSAADRYLRYFAENCTHTVTGLFPWGEHSFWHLTENRVGNSKREACGNMDHACPMHDHLRHVPEWLWDKLWEFNSRCVERFAEGLDFHWQEGRTEYIRHARIEERAPFGKGRSSCDFPRHGGFYICDWTFAWVKTGRDDFRQQILRMLDYWWEKRSPEGLLYLESRIDDSNGPGVKTPGQTISLAASLLESAHLLRASDPALASLMEGRAERYIDGFLNAPHDIPAGIFLLSVASDTRSGGGGMPTWGSRYGYWTVAYIALTCLCVYRIRRDDRLLRWAEAAGRRYLEEAFPLDIHVPAMDAGLCMELLADLYEITGKSEWILGAHALSQQLIPIYFDAALPRGASNVDWYESQMGPGFLIHGLARISLLADGFSPCPLPPDYTAR